MSHSEALGKRREYYSDPYDTVDSNLNDPLPKRPADIPVVSVSNANYHITQIAVHPVATSTSEHSPEVTPIDHKPPVGVPVPIVPFLPGGDMPGGGSTIKGDPSIEKYCEMNPLHCNVQDPDAPVAKPVGEPGVSPSEPPAVKPSIPENVSQDLLKFNERTEKSFFENMGAEETAAWEEASAVNVAIADEAIAAQAAEQIALAEIEVTEALAEEVAAELAAEVGVEFGVELAAMLGLDASAEGVDVLLLGLGIFLV